MRKRNKREGLNIEELEKRVMKIIKEFRNKKVSFTHNELKKLATEWDKGHGLMPYEEKAVENHLIKCESCMRMLRQKHVNTEVIK